MFDYLQFDHLNFYYQYNGLFSRPKIILPLYVTDICTLTSYFYCKSKLCSKCSYQFFDPNAQSGSVTAPILNESQKTSGR